MLVIFCMWWNSVTKRLLWLKFAI